MFTPKKTALPSNKLLRSWFMFTHLPTDLSTSSNTVTCFLRFPHLWCTSTLSLSPPRVSAGRDLHHSVSPCAGALRLQRRQHRRGATAGRLQRQGAGAGGALHKGSGADGRAAEDAGDRLRGVSWGIK